MLEHRLRVDFGGLGGDTSGVAAGRSRGRFGSALAPGFGRDGLDLRAHVRDHVRKEFEVRERAVLDRQRRESSAIQSRSRSMLRSTATSFTGVVFGSAASEAFGTGPGAAIANIASATVGGAAMGGPALAVIAGLTAAVQNLEKLIGGVNKVLDKQQARIKDLETQIRQRAKELEKDFDESRKDMESEIETRRKLMAFDVEVRRYREDRFSRVTTVPN